MSALPGAQVATPDPAAAADCSDAEVYSSAGLTADLRWWSAANYLAAAQLYLQDNVLLRRRLQPSDIKPRLIGHWGTCPGLTMIYAALNTHIRRTGTEWMLVSGPGHGAPALLAAAYLDGTYSEMYPHVTPDGAGIRALCRQFSTPGGVSSHSGVQTPGSIHEGGELGYSLIHAAGAVFDNPDLQVACVVGDGEAETGPASAAWSLPAFLNPVRDGAVLPILHLNDAKISGPTVFGRSSDSEVGAHLEGRGWDVEFVEGTDPRAVFPALLAAIARASGRIRSQQHQARSGNRPAPRWPMIVLRTPKGWTGPVTVDGTRIEGTHRAHQIPLAHVRDNPEHLQMLEAWLRSYRPQELFDDDGVLDPELQELAPLGDKRLAANPHANGRSGVRGVPPIPDLADVAVAVTEPGALTYPTTRVVGDLLARIYRDDRTATGPGTFRLFCPDETASNGLDDVFTATQRCWQLATTPDDDALSADGSVMEVLSEHLCQGWLEGYALTGRHGLFATYEAFAMVSASMLVQHIKWLEQAREVSWRRSVPSLNIMLTSTCWRNDHNGFSHQGPGLIDVVLPLAGSVGRVWFPPDANCLLWVIDRCLRSTDAANLIVVDKQPHFQYLALDQAVRHCESGMAVWDWAGHEVAPHPDVVLLCIGDVPTEETLAAAQLLREWVPDLSVRVVNCVDLMTLASDLERPEGLAAGAFEELFTACGPVVVAFHGYARALHQLLHGRPAPSRFHVHGFHERGFTTTPFDMVVINEMSRFHLAVDCVERAGWGSSEQARALIEHCHAELDRHHEYVREHFVDMPEITQWQWRWNRSTKNAAE